MLLLQATRRALPSLHVLAENGMRALGLPQSRDMSNVAVHGLKAGPGGRSSVSGIVATVFGANGFIGSYITNEIAKTGSQVVCPFRSVENDVMHLKQMGDLGQIVLLPEFSIRDDDAIRHAISRSNVVVNLVGQRTETMNFSYEDAHVDFPRRLAKICTESGHIERLIQFSEIGASETSKSHRLRTKALGDKAVSEAFPDATIVRPGPVVGIEDYFYNYIIYQLQFSVIAPIIDNGANKMAPTYVLDVAAAAAKIISRPDTAGKTFYLAGPETLTMREIYDVIIKTLRLRQDDSVHVPAWLLKQLWRFKDSSRRYLPSLPVASYMASVDYVEEQLVDALPPPGALGYADLDHRPVKVTDGLAIEPVRHFRVGGYQWGDMARVASNVPENIKKYYNIKA